ncbi:hypothetical protein HYS54_05070 [Candidatus Micrarchaeota archaeon]|nr:hypothetical protein [Candidatus Micrarchaeota archaeon]
MRLENEMAIACVLAGLLLSYVFSPTNSYEPKTLIQLNASCSGLVRVDATVTKTFFSQKSSLIGLLADDGGSMLSVMNDFPVMEGDRVTVFGRASRQGKQCWLFPKRVVRHRGPS